MACRYAKSMERLPGLNSVIPNFSMHSRRQNDLQVRIPEKRKQNCLYLLVDSTSIKMMGDGE
ncbi:hypothetical protein GCM10027202_21000 [Microvirgula curvata]